MSRKVLVTGATGQIGSQLAIRLAKNYPDLEVLAFVRNPDKASDLRNAGIRIIEGSFENQDAVRSSVKNIDTLVLITQANPNASRQASAFITAAKDDGARKIVRISALKADPSGPTDNTRQHGVTDNEIKFSGLNYVILRPHYYMQNFFSSVPSIKNEGNIYMGVGYGRLGMIDVRDIVDCVERCVVSDDFNNHILTPTGPESINFYKVADAFSEALGRKVNYIPVPPEAVRDALLKMGAGDWGAQVMTDYSIAYSNGFGDFTTNDVEKITGHKPGSIYDFANEVFKYAF
jgi:NAD(P)H dehydrogenase (quinone)